VRPGVSCDGAQGFQSSSPEIQKGTHPQSHARTLVKECRCDVSSYDGVGTYYIGAGT